MTQKTQRQHAFGSRESWRLSPRVNHSQRTTRESASGISSASANETNDDERVNESGERGQFVHFKESFVRTDSFANEPTLLHMYLHTLLLTLPFLILAFLFSIFDTFEAAAYCCRLRFGFCLTNVLQWDLILCNAAFDLLLMGSFVWATVNWLCWMVCGNVFVVWSYATVLWALHSVWYMVCSNPTGLWTVSCSRLILVHTFCICPSIQI